MADTGRPSVDCASARPGPWWGKIQPGKVQEMKDPDIGPDHGVIEGDLAKDE